jgi:uncharacterized phage-associated protein
MNFKNEPRKTTQAVARLIAKSGGPIDYLRLAKLIYLADRQSILSRGVPIVGGLYYSMSKGPAIGELINLVNQRHYPEWAATISPRFGNEIRLEAVPAFDALSESELTILDLVIAQHAHRTTLELVQWCHENCPEYEEVPPNGRKPIRVEAILKGAKKSARCIQTVLDNAREVEEMDALLN